jgi:type II secretory pathway pseudopilin PulG
MHRTTHRSSQSGMSLLETMIALAILLITSIGIMTIATLALTTTEDQGHLMARAAEYAQDKMEQLISLGYCDTSTDTAVFPATVGTGTGLGPIATCPSTTLAGTGTVYGSSDPSAPTTGYVDYLDTAGNQLTIVGGVAPTNWFYIRAWKIEVPTGTTNLKKITVTAKVRSTIGKPAGALPQATMVSWKTFPF